MNWVWEHAKFRTNREIEVDRTISTTTTIPLAKHATWGCHRYMFRHTAIRDGSEPNRFLSWQPGTRTYVFGKRRGPSGLHTQWRGAVRLHAANIPVFLVPSQAQPFRHQKKITFRLVIQRISSTRTTIHHKSQGLRWPSLPCNLFDESTCLATFQKLLIQETSATTLVLQSRVIPQILSVVSSSSS